MPTSSPSQGAGKEWPPVRMGRRVPTQPPHPMDFPTCTCGCNREAETYIPESAITPLVAALEEIAADKFFFCNKCGHMGEAGPEHDGCSYLAGESVPSTLARKALADFQSSNPAEDRTADRVQERLKLKELLLGEEARDAAVKRYVEASDETGVDCGEVSDLCMGAALCAAWDAATGHTFDLPVDPNQGGSDGC